MYMEFGPLVNLLVGINQVIQGTRIVALKEGLFVLLVVVMIFVLPGCFCR